MIRELRAPRGWGALVIELVAAECVTDPRPVETLVNLLRLHAEDMPSPAHGLISAPLGEFPDPVTKLSIDEATRGLLACFNAGHIPVPPR